VTRDRELVHAELVEQRQDISLQLLLLVAGSRRVRPAEAAEVGRDHARVRRDQRDDLAP
jgi:hypothetical protein